ncbi:MAG TPA: MarC family protein [Parachlamydiaceae bacterium]|nr:MarC family protein [Parachlamydiaceae bacterium]
MNIFTLTIILFLIMDPIGNISSFLAMLKGLPQERRKYVIIREMLIALAAMLFFNFLGEYIFYILDIDESTLQLASGAILLLVAIKILFPSTDSLRANLPAGEPFITPLAIPLIAGPSLLATIMLFAHFEPNMSVMFMAIIIAWVLAALVLLCGSTLQRLIGTNGLMACERLMGMVLIMIAIQRFAEGIQTFVKAGHA